MSKNNPQKKKLKRLLKVNPRVFVILKKFPFPPELSRTIREKLWCDREVIIVTFSPELHKAQFKWNVSKRVWCVSPSQTCGVVTTTYT